MDFMAIYGEAGMIGVVGVMFVYLVVSMSKKSDAQQKTLEDLKVENRGQSETLANMEGMIIKLIEFSITKNGVLILFIAIVLSYVVVGGFFSEIIEEIF